MKYGFLLRFFICTLVFGTLLFSYIEKQNELTRLRLEVPKVKKEIKNLKEEVARLKYEVDQFESPTHLMELARMPEFSHLKHPNIGDVLSCDEGLAVLSEKKEIVEGRRAPFQTTLSSIYLSE